MPRQSASPAGPKPGRPKATPWGAYLDAVSLGRDHVTAARAGGFDPEQLWLEIQSDPDLRRARGLRLSAAAEVELRKAEARLAELQKPLNINPLVQHLRQRGGVYRSEAELVLRGLAADRANQIKLAVELVVHARWKLQKLAADLYGGEASAAAGEMDNGDFVLRVVRNGDRPAAAAKPAAAKPRREPEPDEPVVW